MSIKLKWYDENCYIDDDGRRVPPEEVRRRRAYYEYIDTDALKKMWDDLPLGSGDSSIMAEVLDKRGAM